jgi:hypothetical protein
LGCAKRNPLFLWGKINFFIFQREVQSKDFLGKEFFGVQFCVLRDCAQCFCVFDPVFERFDPSPNVLFKTGNLPLQRLSFGHEAILVFQVFFPLNILVQQDVALEVRKELVTHIQEQQQDGLADLAKTSAELSSRLGSVSSGLYDLNLNMFRQDFHTSTEMSAVFRILADLCWDVEAWMKRKESEAVVG